MASIEFSRADFQKFKKAYNEAVANGKDQFTFMGNEFVTGYAKYLIEYLEPKLGTNAKHN
jgi:hypothetical protein